MQRDLGSGSAVGPVAQQRPSFGAWAARAVTRKAGGAGWIIAFFVVQFGCQFALLTKELAPARVIFRSAAFSVSLLFLLLVPGSSRERTAARACALVVMAILTLSAFNPSGGPLLAVAAHWAMYLAVLAPLFWVARLELSDKLLGKLLVVLWLFHTASSVTGMLQVYFPGRFQPALTTFIAENQMLLIRLASGEYVPRPMGLTDTPGGASSSGVRAALLGIGIILTQPFRGARIAGLLSMTVGMACIYLSQVRAALVMLGICFSVVVTLLALSGRVSRFASAVVGAGIVALGGFYLAFDLAGNTVTARLESLVQSDPGTVYRTSRGFMMEHAFSVLLPEYPLGAGLGRWGMMSVYFGSPDDNIWAEVQWVGWLIDGGIPLILAYGGAVLVTIFYAMRASLTTRDPSLQGWAAVVAAYDVGCLALCFSFVPFMGTGGVEFWLLNTVLAQTVRARIVRTEPRAAESGVTSAFARWKPGNSRAGTRS